MTDEKRRKGKTVGSRQEEAAVDSWQLALIINLLIYQLSVAIS